MNRQEIQEIKEKFARSVTQVRFWDVLDFYFEGYKSKEEEGDKLRFTVEFSNVIDHLMTLSAKKEKDNLIHKNSMIVKDHEDNEYYLIKKESANGPETE